MTNQLGFYQPLSALLVTGEFSSQWASNAESVKCLTRKHEWTTDCTIRVLNLDLDPKSWARFVSRARGKLRESSNYAQPITGHVTEVTCPVIDRAQSELTQSKIQKTGGWINIKMPSYQYRKSHCGDKTILRPSYLHNGISHTGKTTSLHWIRAQISSHMP